MGRSRTLLLVGVVLCTLGLLIFSYIISGNHRVVELPPPDPASVREEEHPFMVGVDTYRDIYLGLATDRDHIEDNIRRRYGTTPFDLPSAASCLVGDLAVGKAPSNLTLAWEKLLTAEAIQVCLARVLNRFSDSESAITWLTAQGLIPNGRSDDPDLGLPLWFQWSPKRPGGPAAWWKALSERERDWVVGLTVMIEVCDDRIHCRQLVGAKQLPPFYRATVQSNSRYQK